MKKTICGILMVSLLIAAGPTAAFSKITDGFALEPASTLNRGAWNLKSYLEFGSGIQPIDVTVGTTKAAIKVDSIRLPIEVRYGIADRWEVGGDIGFESDDGTAITAGGTTLRILDGSGLQRIQLVGKWNFWQDLAAMANLAFAGDNALYYSLDGFDFGLKFMYGPQVGAGNLNLNLGLLFKGGDADLDGDGKSSASEAYDNVFSYGIGYVYPYSDRFSGIIELVGSSSPYKGGADVGTNDAMSFLLGARYGFTDQFLLDGGFGIGLGDGSPNFMMKVGMDWMWGEPAEYSSAAPADRREPATSGSQKQPEKAAAKPEQPKTPAKNEPYYEPPTRYEVPKPAEPAKPAGPTIEEQLQTRIADASAAFNRQDYPSAAAHYEAAIKLKDNDPVIHYNLATTYFQLKKYADAKTYYKNSVSLNPADADSHLYLGYTYYYLQDQSSAAKEWQKVLEIDPSNTLARDNLKSLGIE